MSDPSVLALDLGTHAAKALLFDSQGECLAKAIQSISIRYPAPGQAEQDPSEILSACRAVLDEILSCASSTPSCLGIATQRSSVAFWDKSSGEALAPVLGWQDTRAADRLIPLVAQEPEIARRTGLRLSPHYGASKLAWALEELPATAAARREGRLGMGPLAAWLLAGLAAGRPHTTDHANASRTLLWNLETRDWDPFLLDLFGLEAADLPIARPIHFAHGILEGTDIPIHAMSGDQNAALFADGPLPADRALVNLGTGAFVLRATGSKPRRHERLLCGLADSDDAGASYLLEGTVNGAGAALDWAERQWGLAPLAPRLDILFGDGIVPAVFLNAVGGLGSPWWRYDVKSCLLDEPRYLKDGRPKNPEAETAIASSVVESVLFHVKANLDLLEEVGPTVHALRVTGGLARADILCTRLADLCGLPVERPAEAEATARGIAWLAAGRPGHWPAASLTCFEPREDRTLFERYRRWFAAMRRHLD